MTSPASLRTPSLLLTLALLVILPLQSQADPVDFTLDDLDGSPVSLSDYRGRWVIVNFWASWCPPCVRELPELARYQRANPGVQVLGINFEETSVEESRRFLERFELNFPNLKIGSTPLVPFEPLEGLPTTAIVSPAGEIVERHMGPVTAAHLETILRRHQH
jgi:thiol-disulfide isomerase/thioredoxin